METATLVPRRRTVEDVAAAALVGGLADAVHDGRPGTVTHGDTPGLLDAGGSPTTTPTATPEVGGDASRCGRGEGSDVKVPVPSPEGATEGR